MSVTVVITCFNYGRYLPEAVASAASQPERPRVVVVDDGSDDPETQAVLDRLEGVELVRQANAGVCAARNAGLARVETPYAIVLDADDRIAPGALGAMLPPLEHDTALGFTYGSMRFFGAWSGILQLPAYDPYRLLYRHTIGLTSLMRREVWEETGGFDESFTALEDWEFWVNALAHGWRGLKVDAVTVEYRKHGSSKVGEDRRVYRAAYRRLRAKHAALYADAPRLARESDLRLPGRLTYRWFWGPRPVPARVETTLHQLLWRSGRNAPET